MFAIPTGIRLLNRTRPPGLSCARRAVWARLPRPTCGHLLSHGGEGWDERVVGRKDPRNFYFGHIWPSLVTSGHLFRLAPFCAPPKIGCQKGPKGAKNGQKVPFGQLLSRCTVLSRAAHRKPAGCGTGKNGTVKKRVETVKKWSSYGCSINDLCKSAKMDGQVFPPPGYRGGGT